jgi:hypothetical protein
MKKQLRWSCSNKWCYSRISNKFNKNSMTQKFLKWAKAKRAVHMQLHQLQMAWSSNWYKNRSKSRECSNSFNLLRKKSMTKKMNKMRLIWVTILNSFSLNKKKSKCSWTRRAKRKMKTMKTMMTRSWLTWMT